MTLSEKSYDPKEESYIQGACWITNSDVPNIKEIMDIQNFIQNDNKMFEYLYGNIVDRNGNIKEFKHKLVEEYIHLGNMISNKIDSEIQNYDSRITQIQQMVYEYMNEPSDSNKNVLKIEISNDSLKLGHELQIKTFSILSQLDANGGAFSSHIMKGNQDLVSIFNQSAKYFPKQWTEMVQIPKLIKKSNRSSYISNDTSLFKNHKGKFQIRQGSDGIYYYPNIDVGAKEYENNFEFKYRHEVLHEMSHMFEQNSHFLKTTTGEFLRSRISDEQGHGTILKKNPDSNVFADSFANSFIGTVYRKDKNENEIFARGTESVLLGANGSLVGLPSIENFPQENFIITANRIDIEHRNLTLGLLAGIKLDQPI